VISPSYFLIFLIFLLPIAAGATAGVAATVPMTAGAVFGWMIS